MTGPLKILLTGATGLVGTAITDAFADQGFLIKAITRRKQLPVKNVTWKIADITDGKINLLKLLEGVDVLVHNAACLLPGNTENEKIALQKTNIYFTKLLVDCAGKQGIKKVIFTSSFSFIAKPIPEVITETAPTRAISSYAASKLAGEILMQENAVKYGFEYNILRISSPVCFNIDRMPLTVVKKWVAQSMQGQNIQVFGNGTRTQDFVAVHDIADAFVNCIQQDKVSGIFNIASGNAISMLDLAKMISDKFSNQYQFSGEDVNENDRWNISIEKAKQQLNYLPKYTSTQVITTLLNNIV